MLTGRPTTVAAAREILGWGLKAVVAKQGKYGATLFTEQDVFALPAYPLEHVVDPTGAGDTFAGGFVGYVAAQGGEPSHEELCRAMAYGTALASFNVEEFPQVAPACVRYTGRAWATDGRASLLLAAFRRDRTPGCARPGGEG
jgi:sugar/nucleoside kinase (ribokinase family)